MTPEQDDEMRATKKARMIAVLVVDDDVDHRDLIERRLVDAGVHVRTARTGEEALGCLEDVDLILLDYRLPGIDGIEVLREIRRHGGPSVVLVTGMGSEDTAVEAMRAGAIDYIVKNPGYLRALPQTVERAWRQHDLARRAEEMQRIALVVSSASDTDATLREIAAGARTLLEADTCALFTTTSDGPELAATAGHEIVDVEALAEEIQDRPSGASPQPIPDRPTTRLLVPLPSAAGEPIGVLAVLMEEPRPYLVEEIRLAETFASFAGIALGRLKQLELERALVVELQRMLDLRRDVVASVSHELRTPLTSVSGFADTLIERWGSLDDARRLEFLHKIRRNAAELEDMVNRLFHFASIESGQAEANPRPFEVGPEIEELLDGLAPTIGDREVRLDAEPVSALADPALFRRTLSNLVSNALKYSGPEGPVSIRVTAEDEMVRIEVADRGVGLTVDEQARVFEPFWRARRVVAEAMRGAGVGLALVHEYVRVMGGDTGVDSELGAGSIFWFTLPRHETGTQAARFRQT